MRFSKKSVLWLLVGVPLLIGTARAQTAGTADHEVVSSAGDQSQPTLTTGEVGEAAEGDVEATSPEGAEGLAVDEGVSAEFSGEIDGGELETAAEVFLDSLADETAEELTERFEEIRAIFEDAELFSEAEYAQFQNLETGDELEYGPIPETVCGTDTRVRIRDTKRIPWRWNCQLLITMGNGRQSRCTGFLIGPRVVITAGHCVYSHANGGWPKKIEVVPGMNGRLKPFGSALGTRYYSVKGWTQSHNTNYDYGAIRLNRRFGSQLGYYGFAALGSGTLRGLTVNLAGYPADKPYGTQWYSWGKISAVASRKFSYYIDTYGGQSGSAVYRLRRGQRHAVGIHTNGGCPNKATRITKSVFKNMLKWKNL